MHLSFSHDRRLVIVGRCGCTLLLLLVFNVSNVYSTSCIQRSDRSAFRKAKVIFLGKAIEYVENTTGEKSVYFTTRFHVEKAWKGVRTPELLIQSDLDLDGSHFETGKRYIVYAYGKELIAPRTCGRSEPVVDLTFAEYERQQKLMAKLNNPWYRFAARLFPF